MQADLAGEDVPVDVPDHVRLVRGAAGPGVLVLLLVDASDVLLLGRAAGAGQTVHRSVSDNSGRSCARAHGNWEIISRNLFPMNLELIPNIAPMNITSLAMLPKPPPPPAMAVAPAPAAADQP